MWCNRENLLKQYDLRTDNQFVEFIIEKLRKENTEIINHTVENIFKMGRPLIIRVFEKIFEHDNISHQINIKNLKRAITELEKSGILYEEKIVGRFLDLIKKYKRHNEIIEIQVSKSLDTLENQLVSSIKINEIKSTQKIYKKWISKVFGTEFQEKNWYTHVLRLSEKLKNNNKPLVRPIKIDLEVYEIIYLAMSTELTINIDPTKNKILELILFYKEYPSCIATCIAYFKLAKDEETAEFIKKKFLKEKNVLKVYKRNKFIKILNCQESKLTETVFEAKQKLNQKTSINRLTQYDSFYLDLEGNGSTVNENTDIHQIYQLLSEGNMKKAVQDIKSKIASSKAERKKITPLLIEVLIKNEQMIEALECLENYEAVFPEKRMSIGILTLKEKIYLNLDSKKLEEVQSLIMKVRGQ
jgi:hypothetical protein